MGASSMMPAEMPATKCFTGVRGSTPSSTSLRQASARAMKPPVTEAVRVPPSPCSTSQSTVMVRSPSRRRSTAARRLRPIRRWISALRPESFSLSMSRRERWRLARGSMEYSAVTQPQPGATWGGTRSSTLALQSTTVSPQRISTLPSANLMKPVVISTGRSSLYFRPSARVICLPPQIRSLTNSLASKGRRSSMPSPRPTNFTGTCSSCAMAMTMPPLAVPSSLVRMMPVRPAVSLNCRA